jgi:colicin import membrane protein
MFKTLTFPLLLSLFFHGLLVAVILIDAPEAKPMVKRATPNYIRAELITMEKPKAKKTTPSKPANKPKPKPKVDDSKARQLAKQQKQRAEQQKQAEVNRQAKEKQQREAQEKQRQQEQLARIQQQSANELDAAIAEEQVQAQSLSDDQLANSYIALITEVIQNNWNRPPSARNSMEAELLLQLVPTGEVVSVKVLRGSGNAAFDRSAENAVLKAERFPELQQLPARVFEKNFRRLRLKFKPEDLRL